MDATSQHSMHGENLIDLNEFLEYYTYVSALYDSDGDYDKILSNTWNVDSNMNPSAIPYAGIPKRITQVNTKERWLNDHHRAVFGGQDYNVINPHANNYQIPFQPVRQNFDPSQLKPAGRLTLPEFEELEQEDHYAQEIKEYRKASNVPQENIYEQKAPVRAFDYSKSQYGSGSKKKYNESPQKPIETNIAGHYDDEVASQHSGRSNHSQNSHHSQYSQRSHQSNQSHRSKQSHNSKQNHNIEHSPQSQHSNHSRNNNQSLHSHGSHHSNHGPSDYGVKPQSQYSSYQQQPNYGQPIGATQNMGYNAPQYNQVPQFYHPKQPTESVAHKNSRYY